MDRENSEVEMEMQRKERLNEKESREARKTARRKSVEVWATDCERAVEPINRADFMSGFDDGWLSRGKADRPLWEKHKEQERQALIAALDERSRLDPDAPTAIVFKESSDSEQLRNTQTALRNLYKAVQKSRAVNDPLGMATAMEEAGRWF